MDCFFVEGFLGTVTGKMCIRQAGQEGGQYTNLLESIRPWIML